MTLDYMDMDFGPTVEEGIDSNHESNTSGTVYSPYKSDKAARMMKSMGYEEGRPLGKPSQNGILEPIQVQKRAGRQGIGFDTDKKRKHSLEVQEYNVVKSEFRNRVREEQDSAKMHAQLVKMQEACFNLDCQRAVVDENELLSDPMKARRANVLYRRPILERACANIDLEIDSDLDEFEALPLEEQLDMANSYLRKKHYYCFWCGVLYDDDYDLMSCPGNSEKAH